MNKLPPSISQLIDEFNKLPGIGQKTSEKFVFYLMKKSPADLESFARAILKLKKDIKLCSSCFNFSESSPCNICADKKRDSATLCVVAEPAEIVAFEKTGQYNGLYFVLGGVIDQPEGVGPEKLRIKELEDRVINNGIKEVIIATNPDMEGETTAIYLAKILKRYQTKITRLAQGLPLGGDIEYADEITLSSSLKNRREI